MSVLYAQVKPSMITNVITVDMKDKITKECKIHGKTQYKLRSADGYYFYYCLKCGVTSASKSRRKFRVGLVSSLGGKCEICGYSKCIEALDFHHVFPEDKSFNISRYSHHCKRSEVKKRSN